jgi:mRNA interferase MazF
LISLDPTKGSERKKTRPCVIVSPNEMNALNTVIVAPMTTKSKPYPMRIPVTFAKKEGYIVLDEIRTIDKSRLVKHLGTLEKSVGLQTLKILREMFEY